MKLLYVKLLYVKLLYVKRREAGGGGADPGYRIKNKNPTQSCGEKDVKTMILAMP